MHDLPNKVRAELQVQLEESYLLADEGGFRSGLDDVVEERLMKTVASLEVKGDRLFHTAIKSANK